MGFEAPIGNPIKYSEERLHELENEIGKNIIKLSECKSKYEEMKHNREEVNERILSLQNKISKQSFDQQDNTNEIHKLQRTYSELIGTSINIEDMHNNSNNINSIMFSDLINKE